MKEVDMYAKLRLIFVRNKSIFQKIESGMTGLGIPDIFFRTKYTDGWIELKEIIWPKKYDTIIKIPFKPGQFSWIKQYSLLCGNMFLICSIRGETNIYIFRRTYIFKEYTQKEFLRKAYYIGKIKNLSIKDFN